MDLRSYQPADREACLAVFDSNLPEHFHISEREEFAAFLHAPPGSYFVIEHDGALVACGGHAMERPDLASLTWLMVRRDLHRNGLGKFLVFAAMRKLSATGNPALVRLHTVPAAAPFFEKLGFRVTNQTPDGIAPGFDRVEMLKKLKVCA
ncbi:MAG: GNAT family N-acetyltransferase [Bryobacterales bacterium]|nr:GNAT family N-acetyltransferase [Bryobacterales bacterium]